MMGRKVSPSSLATNTKEALRIEAERVFRENENAITHRIHL